MTERSPPTSCSMTSPHRPLGTFAPLLTSSSDDGSQHCHVRIGMMIVDDLLGDMPTTCREYLPYIVEGCTEYCRGYICTCTGQSCTRVWRDKGDQEPKAIRCAMYRRAGRNVCGWNDTLFMQMHPVLYVRFEGLPLGSTRLCERESSGTVWPTQDDPPSRTLLARIL